MGLYNRPGVTLGKAKQLQDTADFFGGAFSRQSITVRPGLSANTVFAPLWADPQVCEAGETPLACELRANKPLYVFISLGTNWAPHAERTHTEKLRQIVATVVEHGAIPVLLTKADNIEGDHSLNLALRVWRTTTMRRCSTSGARCSRCPITA
jgi:hypothetical protein